MDSRLVTLVGAAEAGATCVPINIVVGPWVVQGTPVSTAVFLSRTHQSVGQAAVDQMRNRDRRQMVEGKADHVWQAIMQQTAWMVSPIAGASTGPENAISLVDVRLTGGVSGVVGAAAVRVPIASVGVWWLGDFRHEAASFGGGGGVSVSF